MRCLALVALLLCGNSACLHAELFDGALAAARRTTRFLTQEVATHGGYVWRYSEDLSLREGEGVVDTDTIWIQPPGTPAVGEAFVRLYQATGDPAFLDAARQAAEALRRGQMRSGGWQAMIEFEPSRRSRWAYRVDPPRTKAKDQSSLDDDKTQSALRFLIRLDQALQQQDPAVHDTVTYGLERLIRVGQRPNGGFPQVWTDEPIELPADASARATYPETWSWEYPGHNNYWNYYTLNDNLAYDVARTLGLAEQVYHDPQYRTALTRLGDFLLLAQLPDPQPAWAQQYDFHFQPAWARKFEPPAVTGGESQGVIETLLLVYSVTGDRKYLDPVPAALDYLQNSLLPTGQLARFYELQTNRPLYLTTDYRLTYDDSDLPTHYGFQVSSRLDRLRRQYDDRAQADFAPLTDRTDRRRNVSDGQVERVIDELDSRGAWVTPAGLRYHRQSGRVIEMSVTVRNLLLLADFLDAHRPEDGSSVR